MDTITRPEKSDILIVGGGLAGLALADYLARQGREPLIVEQAPQWRDSGYGIGLWKDGLAVLDELGRLESVSKHATDPDEFEIRSSDGGLLTRTTLPAEQTLLLAIYRGDLHAALRESIPDDWIRMGTSPQRIVEQSDGVVVTFNDGTTETFSLVIGADGVHSTVRDQCFEERRRGDVVRVKREARFETAVLFLESERLRRLRDTVVKHTPLFELFLKRHAASR